MKTLKIIGTSIIVVFAAIGLSGIISAGTSRYAFKNAFTDDFVKDNMDALSIKVEAFKDSAIKNGNNPTRFNRFIDSSNKYSYIFNY